MNPLKIVKFLLTGWPVMSTNYAKKVRQTKATFLKEIKKTREMIQIIQAGNTKMQAKIDVMQETANYYVDKWQMSVDAGVNATTELEEFLLKLEALTGGK